MKHRIIMAAVVAGVLALTGCVGVSGTVSAPSPSASKTLPPSKVWVSSPEYDACVDLYRSVPGSSTDPAGSCLRMLGDYELDELVETFADPAQVELLRADLAAQVDAIATPTPTPTPEASTPTVALDDGQLHWLNVQVGAGTEVEQTYRDLYCPMHPEGREYYADLIGRQGGLTTEQVMLWFTEWCGS